MNKIRFLKDGIEILFILFGVALIYTLCKGESFTCFLSLFSMNAILLFIGYFCYANTIGNTKNQHFTTHFNLKYLGNLNELINNFITCDLYFYEQIGNCYIFSSKRHLWHNQRFFVEKINNVLHITCDQYSLNQLKQHPASFLLTEKISEDAKSSKKGK